MERSPNLRNSSIRKEVAPGLTWAVTGSDLIGVQEGNPRLTGANPRVDHLGLVA
jgi:hypothetical protein